MKTMRGSYRQRQGLRDLTAALDLHDARGVEVGSYAGESAVILAASGKFRVLTCVDAWVPTHADGEEAFDAVAAAHPVIRKLKMTSLEAAAAFVDRSLDFVYIDASHRYADVVADIMTWRAKIRRGGYIAGHDYRAPQNREVIKAVKHTLGTPHRIFIDSSWMFRL